MNNHMYSRKKNEDRCLRGTLHLTSGMKLLVVFGTVVLLALVGALYLKFKRAMFVLLLPTTITVLTVVSIILKRHHLTWPIIAVSCFHAVLSAYALLIFSFYFFFKPFYIIMVLNWAFDTLHNDKTPSYYMQCSAIFAGLITFMIFNIWQGIVSFSYRDMLIRDQDIASGPKPTVLVVNKPTEYVSSHY